MSSTRSAPAPDPLPRRWCILLVLCSLLPGAWFAWSWRAMPHLSDYHDDGIYYVGAQALTAGQGYIIASLPDQPAQTKYPPLWPATLALANLAAPGYPANLGWTMFLCWIWIPASAFLLLAWLRHLGLSAPAAAGVTAFWCLNPYVLLFGTMALSEFQFTVLALGTLMALRRDTARWALLAGVLGGLAFLSRTAGIALIPAGIAAYGLRRQWAHLLRFLAVFVPAVVGWAVWCIANRAAGSDEISLYYTNYFGYHLTVYSWSEMHVYLLKNADWILNSLGAYLMPQSGETILERILRQVLAVAGVAGVVRLWRSGQNRDAVPQAVAFWVVSLLLLLFWHFPSSERLILTTVPLWLAGAYIEFRRLAADIASVARKAKGGQKVAGALILALIGAIVVLCARHQWETIFHVLPDYHAARVERLKASEPAVQWIRANVSSDATLLGELDPLLYLRTGRRAAGVILSTAAWYRDDLTPRNAAIRNIAGYAQRHHLDYFVLNDWDFSGGMSEPERAAAIAGYHTDPRLEKVFESGPTTVFRVRLAP